MIFFRLLIILALISSCGGGGGDDGGGGASSGGSSAQEAAEGVIGARVLNGAIDAAPIDLVSSVDGFTQTAMFAETNGFIDISSGLHLFDVSTTRSGASPLLTTGLLQEGNGKHTFILHGDRTEFGLRVNLVSEQLPEVPSGQSLVRVIHGVTGASQLSVNSAAIANFGNVSSYIPITPGQNTILITRAVDQVVFDLVPLDAQEGKAYSIFVAGEFGFFLTSRILVEN